MKTWMLIIMFFLVGAFFIISQHNLALSNPENVSTFFSLYANWLGHITGNTGQLVGYVVKLDWLPNQTTNG